VWDHNSSDWKTWNGTIGDLESGEIGAFNSFFVQTTGAGPTLQIPLSAKTGSKTRFYGKQLAKSETPWVSLKLTNTTHSNELWVMFSDAAQIGFDNMDALKLQPLSAEYVLIASKADSLLLDINALPYSEMEIRVPLHFESTSLGEHTIELSGNELPDDWKIVLYDAELNIRTNLSTNYTFDLGSKQKRETQAVSVTQTPQLKQVRKNGTTEERFVLIITPALMVGTEDDLGIPREVELYQNYPNPFNPSSVIRFGVPNQAPVRLEVFDILGRKVMTLVNGELKQPGRYNIAFDGRSLASGMYIYRLVIGDKVLTKKMTLIK
jgi:hypothetical protein